MTNVRCSGAACYRILGYFIRKIFQMMYIDFIIDRFIFLEVIANIALLFSPFGLFTGYYQALSTHFTS